MSESNRSGVRVVSVLTVAALAAFVLGPLAAYTGVASPMAGFQIFALAGLLAVVTLAVSAVQAVRRGFAAAAQGLIAGAGLLVLFLALAMPGCGVPRINDITTDTTNPPEFVAAVEIPANAGRDMSYPGSEFAEQQREAYPAVLPLSLPHEPETVFAAAERTARAMPRWEVIRVDAARREVEGVAPSAVFRFRDDIVVQVRPGTDGGSLVHMRSKSRDGRSDLGANAARIEAYLEALRAEVEGLPTE